MTENLKACAHDGATLSVVQTRTERVGYATTIVRRKRCPICGTLLKTAEVPLDVAREVFQED